MTGEDSSLGIFDSCPDTCAGTILTAAVEAAVVLMPIAPVPAVVVLLMMPVEFCETIGAMFESFFTIEEVCDDGKEDCESSGGGEGNGNVNKVLNMTPISASVLSSVSSFDWICKAGGGITCVTSWNFDCNRSPDAPDTPV